MRYPCGGGSVDLVFAHAYHSTMDYVQFGLTAAVTLIGSGLGTAIVAAFFKRRFDKELEIQRTFLYRTSQVHQRQIDVLTRLCRYLWEVHAFALLLSKSGVLEGEHAESYPERLAKAISGAREAFIDAKLLVPKDVLVSCEQFLQRVFEWQVDLSWARDPSLEDGVVRAALWSKTQDRAFTELPTLLTAIENEARRIVHAEI